jgi:hypothetical protein
VETIGGKVGAAVQTGTGTFRQRNMDVVVAGTDGTRMTNKPLVIIPAIKRMAISCVQKVVPVRKIDLHDVIVGDHGNSCGFSFRQEWPGCRHCEQTFIGLGYRESR